MIKVRKINSADVYRDGGSYGFRFDSDDGKWYEFFIKSRKFEKDSDTDYHPPIIYLEGCNSGIIAEKLSWSEAQEFIEPLSYENDRFRELVKVVNKSGKGWWNI